MRRYRFSTIRRIVERFERKKVLVVGDLLLDQFVWGDVSRISPEAPVPVVWVRKESYMPGGACNVASNLAAMGSEVSLAGITGADEKGDMLKGLLGERGIDTSGILSVPGRETVLKTRVIAHQQQVVRIDREQLDQLGAEHVRRLTDHVHERIEDLDAIIIEDYGKGAITPALIKNILPIARKKGKLVAVDPKDDHFSYYKGVDVITPNHHEASRAVGFEIKGLPTLEKAGGKLLQKLKCKVVLITLGEGGMMVFRKGAAPRRIPTLAQEVYDVSGAGDTVIALYTLAMASGASPVVSAHIANCAAGIVVGKIGVAMVDKSELLECLQKETRREAV